MSQNLSRAEIETMKGLVMLEFGASWCGYCKAAQPLIEEALSAFPDIYRIRIEDGKGQRLGRSYGVKLWPTLIFLNNGMEVNRIIRPTNVLMIKQVLTPSTKLT
jgi:thioredoxin 1